MQKEQISLQTTKTNAHYQLYLTLEPHTSLEVIILSKLTDSLSRAIITGESMSPSCLNLFGNVDGMYEFMEKNGSNVDKVTISDIGSIDLTQYIDNKGKNIKVGAQFFTEKVQNKEEITQYYLKIIRQWQSKFMRQPAPVPQPLVRTISRTISFQKMYLNVSMDNPYLEIFSKHNNTIKIEEYASRRMKLVFKEIVPKDKNTYVSVKIVKSKENIFGIGLIDRKEDPACKSYYSLCYDFSNGNIKDSTFEKKGKECRWRKMAPNAISLKDSIVRMEIDMVEGRVAYYCNNEWVCETVMPNYMQKCDLVVYLSVRSQGDEFILNQE